MRPQSLNIPSETAYKPVWEFYKHENGKPCLPVRENELDLETRSWTKSELLKCIRDRLLSDFLDDLCNSGFCNDQQ